MVQTAEIKLSEDEATVLIKLLGEHAPKGDLTLTHVVAPEAAQSLLIAKWSTEGSSREAVVRGGKLLVDAEVDSTPLMRWGPA